MLDLGRSRARLGHGPLLAADEVRAVEAPEIGRRTQAEDLREPPPRASRRVREEVEVVPGPVRVELADEKDLHGSASTSSSSITYVRWSNSGSGRRASHFPVLASSATSHANRSEEHTSELQSRVDISYAVFCLKKNTNSNLRKVFRFGALAGRSIRSMLSH